MPVLSVINLFLQTEGGGEGKRNHEREEASSISNSKKAGRERKKGRKLPGKGESYKNVFYSMPLSFSNWRLRVGKKKKSRRKKRDTHGVVPFVYYSGREGKSKRRWRNARGLVPYLTRGPEKRISREEGPPKMPAWHLQLSI